MLNDISTVMWKELRELAFPEGRFRGGARNVIILIAISGVLFPLQSGPAWFSSWLTVYSACFPVILLLNYTADAFAGERERHTLETLLASRLPDRAILLGKVFAIVLYGWALVLVGQPLAVVSVNLAHRGHGLLFYTPAILSAIAGMSLLVSLLLSTTGVLVSLTAPTVRIAGQRMLIPFLLIYGLPGLLPLLTKLTGWRPAFETWQPGWIVAGLGGVCAVIAAVLLAVAVHRFQRERLVLA
jgi:ABC-2 type transport system permease protein